MLEAFLRRMGFGRFRLTHHTQAFLVGFEHVPERMRSQLVGRAIPHFTLTAERLEKLRR